MSGPGWLINTALIHLNTCLSGLNWFRFERERTNLAELTKIQMLGSQFFRVVRIKTLKYGIFTLLSSMIFGQNFFPLKNMMNK